MSVTNPESVRLRRTALDSLHRELGARMVPFAGHELPVQYPKGIRHEHAVTRTAAGLFDISHMGQIRVAGDGAAGLLESLVPSGIADLPVWRQCYTVFTNGCGGVIDDLMVTQLPEALFLVVNGACRQTDLEHLRRHLQPECTVEMLEQQSLLALQGPKAAECLAALAPGTASLKFLQAGEFKLAGADCLVHRCGYTGEDGFEISVPDAQADALARRLLSCPGVEPAGLGARDSLRLEAGLCLYGNDLDASTTPVEAGLNWIIAGRYQGETAAKAVFPGAGTILAQMEQGPPRSRVGLQPVDRTPVRAGALLSDASGTEVGRVTSGGFGCTVNRPIAMGYLRREFAEPGTELQVQVRNRSHSIKVVRMPFIQLHYRR